jgi:CDP-diacylglycerol--glycerol-3-phosphate 3-phosphatidyltransferase
MNIPNFITLVRLIMIPVFLILLTRKPPYVTSALIVFIFSALTDALDGIIARNTGKITGLGKFLDPMADKLLLVSAFTALTILGLVPLWITIIVFARDVFLFIGWLGLFVIGRDVDIQ